MKIYRVAQVAEKLGISKQTLMRYEKKGIVPRSARNRINSWREYTSEDILKMKAILRKGYTVMEVVMVIVVIGVLAALSIPRFESFYAIRLSGGTKKLVSDIRYVQQLAISQHANTRIVFYPDTDRYEAQAEASAGSGVWEYVPDPFTRAAMVMDYRTDPQYRGIDIAQADFSGTTTLQFDWQGVPLAAGQVTLESRGNRNSVVVSQNTGKVSVQ